MTDRQLFNIAGEDASFELTAAQRDIWLDIQRAGASPRHHIGGYVDICGPLNMAALTNVLAEVVTGHDALRTRLVPDPLGGARQVFTPEGTAPTPVLDFSDSASLDQAVARAHQWMRQEFAKPFPPHGPFVQFALLRLGEQQHWWFKKYHHLVVDGWAISRVVQAVAAAYNRDTQPAPPAAFFDWVTQHAQQRAEPRFQASLAYWRAQMAAPQTPLWPVRAAPAPSGLPTSTRHSVWLQPETYARIAAQAQAFDLSSFHVLAAAACVTATHYAGQPSLVLGMPVLNRGSAQDKRVVGLLASFQPVAVQVDSQVSLQALATNIAATARRNYRHGGPSLGDILAQAPARPGTDAQLPFDLTLSYEKHDYQARFGLATARAVALDNGHERNPLAIFVREFHADAPVQIDFDYRHDYFAPDQAQAFANAFLGVLQAWVQTPDSNRVVQLWQSVVPQQALLSRASRISPISTSNRPVAQRFIAQAAINSEALAVSDGVSSVTYAQLEQRTNRLAHALVAAGVRPEAVVGVRLPRSINLVVALLAVLKAGGAYCAIDTEEPAARQASMLSQGGISLVIDEPWLASLDVRSFADTPPVVDLDPQHPAYLLFTSGSTGAPKGVLITHAALAQHMAWMQAHYPLQPGDRVLQKTPVGFDASVWEFWAPLLAGACLVLAPAGSHRDPAALGRCLVDERITVLQATPTLLQALLDAQVLRADLALARLFVGGEALPMALVQAAQAAVPQAQVINLYGPTETCIQVSSWVAHETEATGTAPLGTPIDGARLYVVDRLGQLQPPGVPGQLWIGGCGLARGYVGQPGLTALRFVPDAFAAEPGARAYRSGDAVRWRGDELLYLGRVDGQLKLRGYRMEPGEIEAALKAQPGVAQAAVAVHAVNGVQALVAYLVASAERPDTQTLREGLLARLPTHFVPAHWVWLDALPTTASGKLDRRALPVPEVQRSQRLLPASPTELALAGIWQELLGVPTVYADDDFFALGGHSIKAMQVAVRLRELYRVEPGLRLLFDTPALQSQAAAVDRLRQGTARLVAPALHQRPANRAAPLSFAQQRLWFLAQWPDGAVAYHMSAGVAIQGALQADVLAQAISTIVRRHEVLRTVFALEGGEPVQRVLPPAAVLLPLHDLRHHAANRHDALISELAASEASRPFDLGRDVLLRVALLRTANQAHVLLLTLHHVACDGWSAGVLINELAQLYGQQAALDDLPVQYADFATWQRRWLTEAVLAPQIAHWRERLAQAPVLELPTDWPRPPVLTARGGHTVVVFEAEFTQALRQMCQAHGVTPFMAMTAGYALLLARWAGQDEVVIGTPISNRPHTALEPLIGFFTNTLALRVSLAGDLNFAQLLQQVRTVALDAYDHPDVPFERLVEELKLERRLSHTPLFQAMIAWQLAGANAIELPGLQLRGLPLAYTAAKFDLMLSVEESAGPSHTLACRFEYRADLFAHDTIVQVAQQFKCLMTAAVNNPTLAAWQLPLWPADAQRSLLDHGSRISPISTPNRPVAQRFIAQAAINSEALAVSDGTSSLSYAQLDQRTNRLAHALVAAGVGPEVVVGVRLPRSIDLVVALLAVLKAGGAYCAIDTEEPAQRQASMLAQGGISLVIDETWLASLDLRSFADTPPVVDLDPQHPAYLLFTSGSTGEPKGVLITHAALAQHMAWMQAHYPLQAADRVLQKTPVGFDASVWEFWAPLLAGACLVLAPVGSHRDPAALGRCLVDERITVLQTTPTLLQALLDAQVLRADLALARLFVGGEALPMALVQAAQAAVPQAQVINLYGPTETCIQVSSWVAHETEATGTAPLGTPIDGARLYVVDRLGQLQPPGVPGQLWIGGCGLARGYVGQPGLTALRFVPDAFAAEPGARAYRSGDAVRWRGDELLYLGRVDGQLKLRGYRMEPGEIEAALKAQPGVAQAAVAVHAVNGVQALVAYLVASADRPDTQTLREALLARLPTHFVPAHWVWLQALPTTASGKLDRRALPVPEVQRSKRTLPSSPTEVALAGIWQELLGVPTVYADDDFFALGGHSLKAVQLIHQLRDVFLTEVPLRRVFEQSTLQGLARTVENLAEQGFDPQLAALLAEIENQEAIS